MATNRNPDPNDAFAGCKPQPIRCQWLTDLDREIAPSAEVIRLVVDGMRGNTEEAWANDYYQRFFFRDIRNFVGQTSAILMTEAGSIKAHIDPLTGSLESLSSGIKQLSDALTGVDLCNMEMLLGMDGCFKNEAAPLQLVAYLKGESNLSLKNATVKLYPSGNEASSLVGWEICRDLRRVPKELAATRRVTTSVGTILVLVCFDASVLKDLASYRNKPTDEARLLIREHLLEEIAREPAPEYVFIPTHWQGRSEKTRRLSRGVFHQVARRLVEELNTTVVTTMRAPSDELDSVAHHFPVLGPRSDNVATLLVFDAYGLTSPY